MSSAVMEETLLRLGGTKDVYYMGMDYIGELTLKEAVAEANTGDICIIYCGNGVEEDNEEEYWAPSLKWYFLLRTR